MKKLLILVGTLVLAACAHSPLQIWLQPQVQVAPEAIGEGYSMSISGVNELPGGGLGSLGGVYADTAQVTIGNDAGEAIAAGLRQGFSNWSFRMSDGAPQVDVVAKLVKLTYNSPNTFYTTQIDTSAEINLEVKIGPRTYFGTYSTSGKDRNLVKPSREEVQSRVNGLLSATLQRVFEDQKLKNFLRTNL
ncbi:YajG family lipoprotein [Microbulbifer sp. OS29]|uniref:YajG family lipoprotein n=1 Tax=Microbulbifer okhotskensis TaxID=2926617 RepID=A0A9X2EPQ7_9GAMM|nr:YajG family lipoprotein [Microbulbifer okhotskensis]MCO1333438.1 YajG family lipoprotein [Microbulbifer okhotskensis]